MSIFVISDTHFGHENIIRLGNRPFSSGDAMTKEMIHAWNSVVKPEDTVIHNGDFMWKPKDSYIFNSLNGKKILVKGNHDHKATFDLGWEAVHDYLELRHNGNDFVMFHYPIHSWNGRNKGSIHLYGHVHQNSPEKMVNRHNICVEVIDYTPVNLDEFSKEAFNE